jgi:hypothetical protein
MKVGSPPMVAVGQGAIDLLAHRQDRLPVAVGIRGGGARAFRDAGHAHLEAERALVLLDQAADRRGGGGLRAGGERDVALAGQQPGRDVEADPAGAGEIHFRPGMQIGEIGRGALRPVALGVGVGPELDQVAGHEPGGETEMTRDLHEQPRRIAARALAVAQGFLRRPHAGLHPHDVVHAVAQHRVERHQHRHGTGRRARDAGQQRVEQRTRRQRLAERRQFGVEHRIVGERPFLRLGLEEEVERVDRRHVGEQIDRHLETGDALGKHHPGEEIALRILHPVDEVLRRLDRQRVGQDRRARMRRRPQPDRLRPQHDGAVIGVRSPVRQRDVERHGRGVSGLARREAVTRSALRQPIYRERGR